MSEKKETLLYLPDISGFTDFVNKTEIDHSRHIISELLEIILNSDQLDLTVSEIEGDAVFFFKEDIPAVADLVEQCKNTFINFHNHLRRYDTERICRCGACETASRLTLKFIIHKGIVDKINIKDFQKLHGSDVILAHRLLKNSIDDNEYILFTDDFKTDPGWPALATENWIRTCKGADSYDDQDEIAYSYIPLKNLHKHISEPTVVAFPELKAEKINYENTISAPIDLIYENFTNLDKRQEWNEEIRETILHGGNLSRSGSLHTCLIGPDSLDIESIGRLESEDKIIYGERLNEFKGLKDIISIYTFEKQGDKTYVKVEVGYKIKSWLGKLMKPVVRKKLMNQTIKGVEKLKKISEEHAG